MQNDSGAIYLVVIVLIGILFSLVSLLGLYIFMDPYYHILHQFNKEKGNQTINEIVTQSAINKDDPQRLNEIARLITDDFTDMFWESQQNDQYFCHFKDIQGNDLWAWCPPIYGFLGQDPHGYQYAIDKKGRVRVMKTNDLAFDPKWVAYQKTGACQAISVFFNETVNRSGFVSRIVRSDSVYTTGHFWNEVLIDGEWKFFDVQKYGEIRYSKKYTSNNSSRWFGYQSDFGENTGAGLCNTVKQGVYVLNLTDYGYGENITQFYDSSNNCLHGVHQ